FVHGESGTGKELVARSIHFNSPRAKSGKFVSENCSAIPDTLLESELFGHEKGAFTGANERKRGLFELADKGTIFLDEIGEMEPSTQAKLLRVLERNEFRRVGGAGKIKIDVSVVAASNRDLDAAIAEGRFRNDLYYRLKVVTLAVPPLRDRKEDIPLLVDHFVEDFNRRHGPMIQGVAPRALARLVEHDWPGNVRELRNVVESAAIFAAKDTIQVREVLEALEKATPPGATSALPVNLTLAEAERRLILDAVRRSPTKVEAARSLGIGLRTLYTKLEEYRAVPNQRSPRRDGAPSVSIPRSD
ncbi:MAG TPA: sigma-54 dependent transcriptional regulator, partial [Planctomycetota bacterium]|nr:sigma-54 dependent transcriptional regulator [Planctomycetota bacterium]